MLFVSLILSHQSLAANTEIVAAVRREIVSATTDCTAAVAAVLLCSAIAAAAVVVAFFFCCACCCWCRAIAVAVAVAAVEHRVMCSHVSLHVSHLTESLFAQHIIIFSFCIQAAINHRRTDVRLLACVAMSKKS